MREEDYPDHYQRVALAFDGKAQVYDAFGEGHPNLERMRNKVYAHVLRFLRPGDRILELNAGTGIDAVHFARLGYQVHATDISPGMLGAVRLKIAALRLEGQLSFQACSFTDLSRVEGTPYDYVFSNFGGLNCVSDLRLVAAQMPGVLRPGGRLTWAIMPPVCPWDLALLLRGELKQALRRLRPGGTRANVEGVRFEVRYFTPRQALHALGSEFHRLGQEGLSIFTPPADRKGFALRHPGLYRRLSWLDDRLAAVTPFNGWGDFFLLTAEYRPK